MAALRPRLEELPAEFAVFPLQGALLLPRGRLPLNIFEPRYLAMTEDALAAGRHFGMVQPDEARPPGRDGPALYRVGCLGRLASFSETEDGSYLITLCGVMRFTILEELAPCRGYRRVRADLDGFAADLAAPGPIEGFDREALLADLRGYFKRRGYAANWDAINRLDDDALVTTLATACPFTPAEKQALLEAPTQSGRAGVLAALLRMDRHGDAAEPPHLPS